MAKLRALLFAALATGACGDPVTEAGLEFESLVDARTEPEPEPEPEPEGDPVDVTLTLVDPPGATYPVETYVAFQNGSGAWTKLEKTEGVYRASTTTGRFGFLVVCGNPIIRGYRRVFYQTTDDGTAVTQRSCTGFEGARALFAVEGAVVRDVGESITVDTPAGTGWVFHGAQTRYQAGSMPGANELLFSGTRDARHFRFLRRDLGIVDGDRTVDVSMGDALPGELVPIAIEGVTAADTHIVTGSSISGGVGVDSPVGSYWLPTYEGSAPLLHRLPPALRKPSDVASIYLTAEQPRSDSSMFLYREAHDTAATNIALPALPALVPFVPPRLDVAADTPWTFMLPREPLGADSRLYLNTHWMSVVASASWVARSPTLAVQNPTNLAGWRTEWNVETSDLLWMGYETVTGTQRTASGIEGRPETGAGRATNREASALERQLPCERGWADCARLRLREPANSTTAR